MDKVENQQYLTNFILDTASELGLISQDNPALYNALTDAFQIMSNEFGTGETKLDKVELPKVIEKIEIPIEIPEPKKRGRKKKKAFLTAQEINAMTDDEINTWVMSNISMADLGWINKMLNKRFGVSGGAGVKEGKLFGSDLPPTYNYDDEQIISFEMGSEGVAPTLENSTLGKVRIFIANDINYFLDSDGNKIAFGDRSALEKAPTKVEVSPQQPQTTTSGYEAFKIPDGQGGVKIIYVDKDRKQTFKTDESSLITNGRLLWSKSNDEIFMITDVEQRFFEADVVDEDGDIISNNVFKTYEFLNGIKQNDSFSVVIPESGNYTTGIPYDKFILAKIELSKSTSKKPKKQADPEEIAALELELETAMILAEVGDADEWSTAIETVEKLKKKIAKLKA